jgi:YVTN family beta-propeller protein
MHMQNGKVFVGNITNNMVYVINSSDDAIIDSINVGSSPVSIQEDSRGNLWVLTQGSQNLNKSPSIAIIETQNHSIIKSFLLEDNQSYPSYLNIDIETNNVFLINNHIYKFQNLDDTLPQLIWPNNNNNFYNLKINPYNKDLYITDAKDYVQNGSLIIIDSIGNFKEEIGAGIIPKSIIF